MSTISTVTNYSSSSIYTNTSSSSTLDVDNNTDISTVSSVIGTMSNTSSSSSYSDDYLVAGISGDIYNSTIKGATLIEDTQKRTFADELQSAISKVNDIQIESDSQIEGFIKGENDLTMHEVMLSMQEAQISMNLMLESRNKLYEAYKELTSIQL
jgi:flagellar hook-basal body complex protein FliE